MSALIESQPLAARGPSDAAQPIWRRPSVIAALVFLGTMVLACIAAPLIAPDDPRAQDLSRVLTGPTVHNLLGTDTLGRDVLSRLIYGSRRSLLSVAEGLVAVLSLGVPLGLAAGYFGGWTDRTLSRGAEIVMAIPGVILILVVLAVFPGNEDAAMVAFGVLGAPAVLRVVRGAALKAREELYVTAARVSGLSHLRIVSRHIWPRVTGPIIVQASIFAAYALLFETALSYLGLTADASTPTWGGMVGEASTVITQHEWLLFPPGVVIALTILAFGMLGDGVRDAMARDDSRRSREHPAGRITPAPGDEALTTQPDPMRRQPLLSVQNLSVAFDPGATRIVDRVSFDIFGGETVGLVGESGCGKTVTALAILRLLPPSLWPVGGKVRYEGHDLLRQDDREFDKFRGATFAYVAQEPHASLDPTFSIGAQLVEVISHHERIRRRAAKRRALELLRMVELPDPESVAKSHAHELSGGMAQRVALALALAGRPRLLIADEPTTALDVTVQAEILQLLRHLQEVTGMAVLVITHNWGVVADLCDRTIVMYAGQIVEQSRVQRMFDQPLHPYTLGLLESHPSLAKRGERLAAIPGTVAPPGGWPDGCRFSPRCRFATPECLVSPVPLLAAEDGRSSRCLHIDELEGVRVS